MKNEQIVPTGSGYVCRYLIFLIDKQYLAVQVRPSSSRNYRQRQGAAYSEVKAAPSGAELGMGSYEQAPLFR